MDGWMGLRGEFIFVCCCTHLSTCKLKEKSNIRIVSSLLKTDFYVGLLAGLRLFVIGVLKRNESSAASRLSFSKVINFTCLESRETYVAGFILQRFFKYCGPMIKTWT